MTRRVTGVLLTLAALAAAPSAATAAAGPRARLVLLPGSTLTATVPLRAVQPVGPRHPDRSTALTGTLRTRSAAAFDPGADINDLVFRGALDDTSLAPDPLCPESAAGTLGAVAASRMGLSVTGATDLSLVLKGSPSQIFGCGAAGTLAGTTTIPLRGRRGPQGLRAITLTGDLADIALPDGAKGTLTAKLKVRIVVRRKRTAASSP